MNKTLKLLLLSAVGCQFPSLYSHAQRVSCASFLNPQPKADVTVPFRVADAGTPTPIEWGLDLAWLSEDNVRTGVLYAGRDLIDIIRLSFQPTAGVENGTWSADQQNDLRKRADIARKWLKPNVGVYVNDDHKSVDDWYNSTDVSSQERGRRWAKVIDMAVDYYKSRGLTNLVALQGFNEPDYGWDQGAPGQTKPDQKNVYRALREDEGWKEKYANVRMCGANTLNDDKALEWYNYMLPYINEGNTHQLAGDFNHYADFFKAVRQNGHHATADELHNVMEAMVGVEYGMQTGIWWGTNEHVRTLFMQATGHANPGQRLAYGEHRNNWTSASVYRMPDGTMQAFGGMSERQSYTTRYDFVATDRPVWYDGQRGRSYSMYLPGGTGYQVGQTNAEVAVQVQSGSDIMPHIQAGTYKIMNVNSGKLMGFSSKPTSGWTSVTQRNNNNTYKYLQWKLTPLQTTGDFSYWKFELNTDNGMLLDLKDWNYNDGADVGVYPGDGNVLEQWYLQYAGNGAFYIRNRYSNKCLEVADGRTTAGSNIQCGEFKGETYQQWCFLSTNVTPNQVAPAAPTALQVTPGAASIQLQWVAPADKDVLEYVVLRNGYALAKGLTECEFVDNEAELDSVYTYSVYAIDKSLNYGAHSEEVKGVAVTGEQTLVQALALETDLNDSSDNANHVAVNGTPKFATRGDHTGLDFEGTSTYAQLPYTIATHNDLTISCWLYYRGGSQWQRVWDFGNDTEHYMFLTSNYGGGVRFAIKNGNAEEHVDAGKTILSNRWHHLVVTISDKEAKLYVNGTLCGTKTLNISPAELRPTLNYIGRSQFSADPLLRGTVRDFRIYNYALSAEQIQNHATAVNAVEAATTDSSEAYDLNGRRADKNDRLVIKDGRKMLR